MDFTREPVVETVITPKEGYKLVVRSSKSTGQEEYFVDAVEVVCFGQALFFRSLERPKSFLVPISDYEVLEVREARMVLKNVGIDQSIKIAGGRETHIRAPREAEKVEATIAKTESIDEDKTLAAGQRQDKKRERRRHSRRRRGHEEREEGFQEGVSPSSEEEGAQTQEKTGALHPIGKLEEGAVISTPLIFSALLQPPPTLISETIGRYKETFKEAFFTTDDVVENEAFVPHDKVQELLEEDEEFVGPISEPDYEPANEGQLEEAKEEPQGDLNEAGEVFWEEKEKAAEEEPPFEFFTPSKDE